MPSSGGDWRPHWQRGAMGSGRTMKDRILAAKLGGGRLSLKERVRMFSSRGARDRYGLGRCVFNSRGDVLWLVKKAIKHSREARDRD